MHVYHIQNITMCYIKNNGNNMISTCITSVIEEKSFYLSFHFGPVEHNVIVVTYIGFEKL